MKYKHFSIQNLFSKSVPNSGELFETLLKNDEVTIEVIISSNSPEPTQYNQTYDEAVLLITGKANLLINEKEVVMNPGDFLHIPANTPHKVLKTEKGTRWLAIHTKGALC
ncbi:cupin domain-containing protein [Hydrogenimonas thermophila]|uniref:cupin domain-containing protein n=1 Tax=Hydrogenimonas thermophila TaxID=223786 RepID=UPI002936E10C|nr:cupin domain-containing protein [Hydrogenimonas thermophila]WOE69738.1 cupin domain-containing protein [Hydrogenimonas thermophila]WOE72252.1 cupin domain-containing protein [Hydrogenimonas thermophila]